MKSKLLTLALLGLLTVGFVSCADEEIAPSNDVTQVSATVDDPGMHRPLPRRD